MKAVLFKYDANPNYRDLRDGADNRCGLVDPDFRSNGVPIWAVCGPYVRQRLQVGDILFFLPHKRRIVEAGLKPRYICTGVLVVSHTIDDSDQLIADSRINERYKRKYLESLRSHVSHDKQRTGNIRRLKIILGSRDKSKWLGREGPVMEVVYGRLGLDATNLSNRRIPYIDKPELVQDLYEAVVGRPR